MSVYKVEICGVNTAKLPILKEEEKAALFARIKQGDMTARETYIKGNLRLVLSVITRFSGNQENIDKLITVEKGDAALFQTLWDSMNAFDLYFNIIEP